VFFVSFLPKQQRTPPTKINFRQQQQQQQTSNNNNNKLQTTTTRQLFGIVCGGVYSSSPS
jgi:hypothetical protein